MSLRVRRDGQWVDVGGEQWVAPPNQNLAANAANLFYNWAWLEDAPEVDISGATSVSGMFQACRSLKNVPLLDTSSVRNFTNMFFGCTSLEQIPPLDTSSGTNFTGMFRNCGSLTELPSTLDTSSATNVSNMFSNCGSLTAINLDLSSVTTSASWSYLDSLQSCLLHGMTQDISITDTDLDGPALNDLFYSLGQAEPGAAIDIFGAPGAFSCDTSIAIAKGWVVRL